MLVFQQVIFSYQCPSLHHFPVWDSRKVYMSLVPLASNNLKWNAVWTFKMQHWIFFPLTKVQKFIKEKPMKANGNIFTIYSGTEMEILLHSEFFNSSVNEAKNKCNKWDSAVLLSELVLFYLKAICSIYYSLALPWAAFPQKAGCTGILVGMVPLGWEECPS